MKSKNFVILAILLVITSSIMVYSADAAGIPKKAISLVSTFIKTDLPSTTVFNDQANTYTAGSKQTYQNSATTSGFNIAQSADPSTLSTGDVWFSSTTANSLKYRDASSTTRTLTDLSLTQTLTGKSMDGGSNTFTNIPKNAIPGTTVYTDNTNTFGAFDQLFKALNLKIVDGTDVSKIVTFDNSGMTTAKTLTIKPLSTTTQTLQIPSITATDTLATLGLPQTFTGINTYTGTIDLFNSGTEKIGNSKLIIRDPASTFATTISNSAQTANTTLTLPLGSGTVATLTRINGASGAAGTDATWQKLSADATTITSTTPAVVMTTTGVGPGTWHFRYIVIYQSAATTTGLGITVNHSGTTGTFVMNWIHVTTGGAAATGIGDMTTVTNAGQLVEGKAERTINTVSSASAGVGLANANMMSIVDGVVVVTVSGDLQLKVRSEVSGSGITVKSDSILELNKIG